jgi:hypothetical protein
MDLLIRRSEWGRDQRPLSAALQREATANMNQRSDARAVSKQAFCWFSLGVPHSYQIVDRFNNMV